MMFCICKDFHSTMFLSCIELLWGFDEFHYLFLHLTYRRKPADQKTHDTSKLNSTSTQQTINHSLSIIGFKIWNIPSTVSQQLDSKECLTNRSPKRVHHQLSWTLEMCAKTSNQCFSADQLRVKIIVNLGVQTRNTSVLKSTSTKHFVQKFLS